MINRILLAIFVLLCIGQTYAQDYLSVAVMLPAKNHYQLQSALKSFNKAFPQVKSEPTDQAGWHMTLINLRIEVKDGLSKQFKNLIKERVEGVLKQSVKTNLRWNHPSLLFDTIQTFRNKIVATFKLDQACIKIIASLEEDVKNDPTIKVWLREGSITCIRHAHEPIVPHVSLATISQADQGYTYIPTKPVPPFMVHHHGNWITAYWHGTENEITAKIPYKIIAGAFIGAAVMIYVMKKYW